MKQTSDHEEFLRRKRIEMEQEEWSRDAKRRQFERMRDLLRKEDRWQRHLIDRADGLSRSLWVTWNEV